MIAARIDRRTVMVKSSESVRIGVVSDTHGYLDPQVLEEFAGVDHIIHAGDIMDAVHARGALRRRPRDRRRRQHGRRQARQAAARGRRQGRRRPVHRRPQAQAAAQAARARQDRGGRQARLHRTSSCAGTTTCRRWSGSTARSSSIPGRRARRTTRTTTRPSPSSRAGRSGLDVRFVRIPRRADDDAARGCA